LTVWQVRRDVPLAWEFVDERFVVFHGGSGLTHLLDWLSGEVLLRLAHAPATTQNLSAFVAGLLEESPGGEIDRLTTGILARLEQAWLVERTAS